VEVHCEVEYVVGWWCEDGGAAVKGVIHCVLEVTYDYDLELWVFVPVVFDVLICFG